MLHHLNDVRVNDSKQPCCTRHEGGPLGLELQGSGPNHRFTHVRLPSAHLTGMSRLFRNAHDPGHWTDAASGVSRSVSGACAAERCSPSSVPFPPQPPQKVALPCSAGSQVLRHSPTSPARTCPPFGLWPSRTGLDRQTKARWRSPGSRACCFSACAGSQTTQDRTATRV